MLVYVRLDALGDLGIALFLPVAYQAPDLEADLQVAEEVRCRDGAEIEGVAGEIGSQMLGLAFAAQCEGFCVLGCEKWTSSERMSGWVKEGERKWGGFIPAVRFCVGKSRM